MTCPYGEYCDCGNETDLELDDGLPQIKTAFNDNDDLDEELPF